MVETIYEILNFPIVVIAGTAITLATILIFAALIAVTYWLSRLVQRAAERALRMRGVNDMGTLGTTRRLTHYGVMGIGLGIALETIGINLAALFAAGAVFAVAIGFAMQNITQNFVSGVILLMERSIKPGDVLEVEQRVVQVQKMGIRSTIARTRDEEELIIPNATLVQSTVKNFTLRDSLYRVRAVVGVSYRSDMARVRSVLEAMAEALAWRNAERQPRVRLLQFGASTVDWEVSVWIDDPWESRNVLSHLHEAIWWALKEAQIEIAFPQVDVHFDRPVVEALERVPG